VGEPFRGTGDPRGRGCEPGLALALEPWTAGHREYLRLPWPAGSESEDGVPSWGLFVMPRNLACAHGLGAGRWPRAARHASHFVECLTPHAGPAEDHGKHPCCGPRIASAACRYEVTFLPAHCVSELAVHSGAASIPGRTDGTAGLSTGQ